MNEPIAWMYEDANGTMKMLGNTRLEEWVTKFGCKEIPLYTHPAKTLTHDEIAEIYHSENRFSPQGNFLYYGFARAILRKAQNG